MEGVWSSLSDDFKSLIDGLSTKQKDELLALLSYKKEQNKKNYWEPISELVWDFDKVLKYICDNCVKKRSFEKFWENWTLILVKLPAVWTFEWFEFSCFIPNRYFEYRKYKDTYDSISYSMEEICNLLEKINEFLCVYWVWRADVKKNDVPRVACGQFLMSWVVLKKIFDESELWLADKMPPFGNSVLKLPGYHNGTEFISGWKHTTTYLESRNYKLRGNEYTRTSEEESTEYDKYRCLFKM